MSKNVALLYHKIVKDGENQLYEREESNFRNDMEYLKKYQIISLYDLVLGEKSNNKIIITFDDGDSSNYSIAFPILKEYGFKATFFVISDKVGKEGYVNWNEIRDIGDYKNEKGERLFDIESHTHTHLDLAQHGEERILYELKHSQGTIRKETGTTPRFLAIPGGSRGSKYEIIRETARRLGYLGIRNSSLTVLNNTNIREIRIWIKYSFLILPLRIINKLKRRYSLEKRQKLV